MNNKFISIIILVIMIVILSITLFLISRYNKRNKNETANESAESDKPNDKIENIENDDENINNQNNDNENNYSNDDENENYNDLERKANKLIEENNVPTFNNFEEQMHVPMQIDKSLLDVMEEKPCDIEINTKDLIKNNKEKTKRSIGIFLVHGGGEMLF